MAYAPNRNQHSSLVWKYLTRRIRRILKLITEIGYDEKMPLECFVYFYLFISHTFHRSMKERTPVRYRTCQKNTHMPAVHNKDQVYVIESA
jgi:hypothetical protein